MPLASSLMSYIRFFTLLSPIMIPTMAIFSSLFNANFKGFVYVLGLTIATTFGSFIAPVIGKKVPQYQVLLLNSFYILFVLRVYIIVRIGFINILLFSKFLHIKKNLLFLSTD